MAAIMPNPAFDLQQKWRRFPEHLDFTISISISIPASQLHQKATYLSPPQKKKKKGVGNSTYKPHKSSTDKQQSAQSSESDSHSSQIDTNPPATTSPLRRFPTRKSLHKSPPRAASLLRVRPVGSRERSRARPCCWSGGRTRSKVRKRSAWSRRRIPWRVDAFFRGGATWLLGLFTEEKNIKISLPQWQKKKKIKKIKTKKGGFKERKKKKKTYKQHNKSQIPQNPSTPSFPEPRDVSNLPSGETWFQSWSKRLVLPTRLQFHPRRDRAWDG